jgi:hypothetical protein
VDTLVEALTQAPRHRHSRTTHSLERLHAALRRGRANTSRGILRFVEECLRRVPRGAKVRARFDSGFYSKDLFAALEAKGITYLVGAPHNPRLAQVIRQIPDEDYGPCIDQKEGQVAEFGYLMAHDERFRRYVVKRIAISPGEQAELETAGYHYWALVTNDHVTDAAALESEHRHKALVESGVRELKENFGPGASKARVHGELGLAADRGNGSQPVPVDPAAR